MSRGSISIGNVGLEPAEASARSAVPTTSPPTITITTWTSSARTRNDRGAPTARSRVRVACFCTVRMRKKNPVTSVTTRNVEEEDDRERLTDGLHAGRCRDRRGAVERIDARDRRGRCVERASEASTPALGCTSAADANTGWSAAVRVRHPTGRLVGGERHEDDRLHAEAAVVGQPDDADAERLRPSRTGDDLDRLADVEAVVAVDRAGDALTRHARGDVPPSTFVGSPGPPSS